MDPARPLCVMALKHSVKAGPPYPISTAAGVSLVFSQSSSTTQKTCFGSVALVKLLLQYGSNMVKTRGITLSQNSQNVCGVTWPMVKDSVHACVCVCVCVLMTVIPVWNAATISNLRTKAENTPYHPIMHLIVALKPGHLFIDNGSDNTAVTLK